MGNIFDNARDVMFNGITATMGYDAVWLPSAGGDTIPARVLYRDNTQTDTVDDHQFNNYQYSMEWRKPYLPGLKEAVDNGNVAEKITITVGTVDIEFYVQRIITLNDGCTYKAFLQKG